MIYQDQEVLELVRLHVKMDDLPLDALEMEMGKDDELYYIFNYTIEVTYQSGSTKYELLHKGEYQIPSHTESWKSRPNANYWVEGKRYSAVSAEYV